MTDSKSFSKPEKSEECKGFSSNISEDLILPFEFPFFSSHELHRDLVGIVTKMVIEDIGPRPTTAFIKISQRDWCSGVLTN